MDANLVTLTAAEAERLAVQIEAAASQLEEELYEHADPDTWSENVELAFDRLSEAAKALRGASVIA